MCTHSCTSRSVGVDARHGPPLHCRLLDACVGGPGSRVDRSAFIALLVASLLGGGSCLRVALFYFDARQRQPTPGAPLVMDERCTLSAALVRHALSGGEGARAALLSTLVPLGIVFVAWSLAKQILIFAGAAVADEAHDEGEGEELDDDDDDDSVEKCM